MNHFGTVKVSEPAAGRARFAGLDPDLRGPALILLGERGHDPLTVCRLGALQTGLGPGRFRRYAAAVAGLLEPLAAHGPPTWLAIMGYNMVYGSVAQAHAIELGALLRWHLVARGWRLVEIPPRTIRKFVTGQGDTDKAIVAQTLAAAFDQPALRVELAPAYALAQIARCIAQPEVYPAWRAEALDRLLTRRGVAWGGQSDG